MKDQNSNPIQADEDGIKHYVRLVDDLHKAFNEPMPGGEDGLKGVNNFTDQNGKVHISKMLRCIMSYQRLLALLDK